MYVGGTSFRGVKDIGTVRASWNIIAVSALRLINHALACVPPPSILYGGMIITGDVLLRTLVDRHVFVVVGLGSSCINAGSALVIFGRAPGVLLRVCRWCMRAVVIKLRFAVGSRVCMIAGASDMRWIVKIGASSITLCASA